MQTRNQWEDVIAKQRAKLVGLDGRIAIQNLEQFHLYLRTALPTRIRSRSTHPLGRFTSNLNKLQNFAITVQSASRMSEASVILWESTRYVVESTRNSASALGRALDLLHQFYYTIPDFDRSPNAYLQIVAHAPVRKCFDAYCTFCISNAHYLRPWKESLWGIWYFMVTPSPSAMLERNRKLLDRCRDEVDILERTELDRLSSSMTPATSVERFSGSSSPSFYSQISTGRPSEDYRFSGRNSELLELHQALRGFPESNPVSWPTSCVIHGIGGVGKTQLALQYTYDPRFSRDYDAVFWVTAETALDLSRSFSLITEKLQSIVTPASSRESSMTRDSTDPSKTIEWFETTASRWLLVFDNVDDYKDIRPYIPRQAVCGAVIITTQMPHIPPQIARTIRRLALSSFDVEDGAQLIMSLLEKDYTNTTSEDRKSALNISRFVGGLPLALTTVCGYVSSSMITLPEALHGLQQSDILWEGAMGSYDVDGQDYDRTLATVFSVALSQLAETHLEVLHILAFLHADMIPEEMLFPENAEPSLQLFTNNSHALQSLNARQLIRRDHPEGGAPYLSMHRTLQLTMLHRLAKDNQKRTDTFSRAFGLVKLQLPQPSKIQVSQPEEWHKYQLYVPQMLNLRKHALWPSPPLQLSMEFAEILIEMGTYMWHTGLWDEARVALDTAYEVILKNGHDESHILISDIDDVVGIIDDLTGVSLREDSFKRRKRALEIRQKELESIPEPKRTRLDKIRLYNAVANLGCAYLQDEDFEKAGELFEDCMKEYKSWTPVEEDIPFEYAKYYHHMAFVYMSRGHAMEAIRMARHACYLTELHHKGPDAPLVQLYRFSLGNHLLHAGKFEEALRINQDCLRDRIRISSERNPMTLESFSTTAQLLCATGRLAEAKEHMQKCLDLCNQCSWSEEGIAMAHFRFSQILRELGELPAAKEQEAKAAEIRNKFRSQYGQFLGKAGKTEEQLHDQMIPIWAGRRTGRLDTFLKQTS